MPNPLTDELSPDAKRELAEIFRGLKAWLPPMNVDRPMAYLNLALHIVDVILLLVIAVMVVQNHSKMEWLPLVLIPFLSSLSWFINPEKK